LFTGNAISLDVARCRWPSLVRSRDANSISTL